MDIDQLIAQLEAARDNGYAGAPVMVLPVDAGSLPPMTVLSIMPEYHKDAGGARTVWLRAEEI